MSAGCHSHSQQKESVALSSMAASAVMALAKFGVGFATGSLGLISEGMHSLLDFGATIITYLAIRISGKPADDAHHYGHGKIESVAALIETGLLFLTSGWIIYEAIHRLATGKTEVEVTWWAIAVIVASIIIDINRARALSRVAKETKSQALEADALHFSSDVLSSAVVLFGLVMVAIGFPLADAIAAIGVSAFVCLAGWRLGKRTVDALTDAAPEGLADQIKSIAMAIPAITKVNRVRARPVGALLFVDIDISVGRGLPLDRVTETKAHLIADVQQKFPEAELMIAIHPVALDSETVHERIGIIAANQRLAVHHVTVHQVDGRLAVGLDLEVDGDMSLGNAHDIATTLEQMVRMELGDDIEVETHIEPLQTEEVEGATVTEDELNKIIAVAKSSVDPNGLIGDIHDVRVRRTEHGLVIIFHCHAESGAKVVDIHDAVDALERKIRSQCAGAWRVVGHAEPHGAHH